MTAVAGTTSERTLFKVLVWIGILLNWTVGAWALLSSGSLVATLALGPPASHA